MTILDKFLGIIGLIRKKAADFPLVSGAGTTFFTTGGGRIAKSKLLGDNKDWVFACVRARAEAVGNIQLKLFEKKKDGTTIEVSQHELLDLLAVVNPFMCQFELFEMLESHLDLVGNAYWFLDGIKSFNDKPTAIYPLNPKYIEIKKGTLPSFIDEYKYTAGSVTRLFKPYEILHFRESNPDDPYNGMGILESIANWVDADNYATEWNRNFFLNAARPDATLEHEADLSEEQMKFLRASFEDAYRGVEKAHRALILPKGVKFSPVGWNQKEMDFVEMQRMTRDKILAGFRVPKTILGLTEDVNRANAEASNYVFALRVIKPQMERIVGYLNEFLVPRYGDNIFLNFVDPVPENRELELIENEKALGAKPYASVNEVREKEGLPPIEGGDSVMTDFASIPLGKPIEEKKENPRIKNQMKPSVRFSRNLKKRKEIGEMIAKETRKILGENIKEVLKVFDEEKWEVAWKGFVVRVTPYEGALKEKIKKFNNEQKEKVLKKLGKEIKGIKQFEDLFDSEEEISILIDGATPILRELLEKEGKEALKLIGVNGVFEANLERVVNSLEKSISLMSENYNETTLNLLKEKLKEGLEAGESLPELTERVRQVYEFSDEVRAERVARTEAFRVANSATKEAWRQSGVVKTLKWYTASDERVCEFCEPMNGKVVEIENNWFEKGDSMVGKNGGKLDIDYSDIENPPLHADCRCYIRPETISIE